MTTPLTLITQSMKDCGFLGVGETPQAEDVQDAFRKLNWMLAEWARNRGIVFHLIDKSFIADGGQEWTVGPGGDIEMSVRPSKMLYAVARQNYTTGNPVDYSLTIFYAREDWQAIVSKTVSGPPRVAFLDTSWPLGRILVWPRPQAGIYQMIFTFPMILEQFTSLTQEINLPPEYESAINWNLALRLSPMTGENAVNPVIAAEAKSSLRVIFNTNSQTRLLRMPDGVRWRGWFDPIGGVWY